MPSLSGAAILFDLDGTLIDTAPDLAGTMNDILSKLNLAPIPIDGVRHLVGRGARALIEHGVAHRGHSATSAEVDQMFDAFIDIYAARIAKDSRPFPGLTDALDQLTAKGASLGVVTNKREDLSRLLLDALHLGNRFGVIVGYETAARPKPFADPIYYACKKLAVPIERTLMIGDSSTDVGAARAAGVKVIAVRHGYSDIEPDALGADAVIDGFGELVETAEGLLK